MGSRSFPDAFPGTAGNGASGQSPQASPLARRPDFTLGAATIRPSVRTIEGPGGGGAAVEPRVMQVLLALADAKGAVLTRGDLERQCWNGQIVGEDALNRAIFELRRAARATGSGLIVETIPRIGYRLVVDAESAETDDVVGAAPPPTRRWVIAGGIAAAAGGLGLWWASRDRADPRAEALLERGRQALSYGMPDAGQQGVRSFTEAVAIAPNDAAAWGWLAVAYRNVAENAGPGGATAAVQACERAARRSLELNPREGNALAALATIRPFFGDWVAAEDRLMSVLAVAPDNFAAMNELILLLQASGRCRASHVWNERAAVLDPLSPLPQYRRALKHWIFGRIPAADLTIDRALQLWPRHPAVWNARMMLFAFTGRARAALAFLEDEEAQPPTLTPATIALWRPSLAALDTRAPADVAAARRANLDAAPRSGGAAVVAIMTMSVLGDLDAAFAISSGYLLRRGALIGTIRTAGGQMPVTDTRWRRTMNLFTPASAAMRADPRFDALCDGIGLSDYWRRRGVAPDYRRDLT